LIVAENWEALHRSLTFRVPLRPRDPFDFIILHP
jgi:hypothetical protein